jgi:hypothetical protein
MVLKMAFYGRCMPMKLAIDLTSFPHIIAQSKGNKMNDKQPMDEDDYNASTYQQNIMLQKNRYPDISGGAIMGAPIIQQLREIDTFDTPYLCDELCAEAASTIEGLIDVLHDVRAFNKGDGKFNFSSLSNYDRANAADDAWQEIASRIDTALAKATT